MMHKLLQSAICLTLSTILAASLMLSRSSYGQSKRFFAEPQSTLLFSGQSATDFLIVTPTGNFTVPGPPGSIMEISSPLPALVPAGDQVASSFRLPVGFVFVPCSKPGCAQPRSAKYKSVMGVYSLRDKAWKLYGDFCFAGSAAFSPDGKRVAFEVTTRADNPNCNSLPGSEMLMILDLETGQFTPVPDTEPVMGNTQLSWSPDGRHLAVQFTKADTPHYLIVLIEIGSWVQNVIAEGTDPSWSPKGDWIAYHAQWNQTCMLIRPDGTGAKMVLDLRSRTSGRLLFKSGWLSYAATVWSPDEEKLLLHEEVMDGVNYNVTILDLATGNTTAKSEKGGHRLWLGA